MGKVFSSNLKSQKSIFFVGPVALLECGATTLRFCISILISFTFVDGAYSAPLCRDLFRGSQQQSVVLSLMEAVKQKQLYEQGFCNCNIQQLVELMRQSNLDLTSAEVLYLIPTKGDDPMLLPKQATSDVEIWDFHVVLEYKGEVYDFDFDGLPLPPSLYLSKMFEVNKGDDDINIRSIPAEEYLRDHQDRRDFLSLYAAGEPLVEQNRDFKWYLRSEGWYPLISVAQYLK